MIEYEIGKKYDVAIEDCCLHVYFVATLTKIEGDDDRPELTFDNGVKIDTYPTSQIKEVV